MPKSLPVKASIFLLLGCFLVSAACAGRISIHTPLRLEDNQPLKSVYYYPHWWEPWRSSDAAVTDDLARMREIGFNTVCLDHEVSQSLDRDWYWLDREYTLATQGGMKILPWLQLQGADRLSLMKFSRLDLKEAVNQDGNPEPDCVNYLDPEFRKALAHYITIYLDRYTQSPAILKVRHNGKLRPVVGLVLEAGWRNGSGLPLSFDDDANAYFRKWMKASYHDLQDLNTKWGTGYSTTEDINPRDKTVFNYDHADKSKMPLPVRQHTLFRARIINDALQDVADRVRKRHKDVLFVAEVAYPFGSDDPKAAVYRWNDANEYSAVGFADIVFIRTLGETTSGLIREHQDVIMDNKKCVILAYRLFDDSSKKKATALALDCAVSANGLAYYNWNETTDDLCMLYGKTDRQELVKIMNNTYDLLCDPDARHNIPPEPAQAPNPAPPAADSGEGVSPESSGIIAEPSIEPQMSPSEESVPPALVSPPMDDKPAEKTDQQPPALPDPA